MSVPDGTAAGGTLMETLGFNPLYLGATGLVAVWLLFVVSPLAGLSFFGGALIGARLVRGRR